MSLRTVSVLLVGAGALLMLSLAKQLILPGLLEFLLITLAHLVLAVAVFGVMSQALRLRAVSLVLGLLWGLAWVGFHAHELLLLLFILPPAWTLPAATSAIVGVGIVCGITAFVWHAGSPMAEAGLSRVTVLAQAVLSSAFIWAPPLVPLELYYPVALGADFVSALSLCVIGVYLFRHRKVREPAPAA